MEHIKVIMEKILKTKNHALKEALVFYRLQDLWPQVAGGALLHNAEICDYRFNILYLGIANSVWAQQITFFKQEIIKKYQILFPQVIIKDIKTQIQKLTPAVTIKNKIKFNKLSAAEKEQLIKDLELEALNLDEEYFQLLAEIINKSKIINKQDKRKVCIKCQKKFNGSGQTCHECREIALKSTDTEIINYLEQAPWTRYTELIAEYKDMDEKRYHQVKEHLINKLQDKLKKFQYVKNIKPTLKKCLKNEALKLVMLQTGQAPDKITTELLETQLRQKLYNNIFL